ncbi:RHS repeat-associated protein [Leifsonia sp. AK011]|uniref:polymorphic toxin type 24 domain-containing protein n=1 Tax=Leifsonia sp. AK011 TaxID=2723075 RepID=UPI0015CC487C|nr:polymorphic toxin type 24 domain-containing protein [Leifsonia sp. AK011]NYF11416.1 RHS repeat-associated protein [Leifsonia sp. AK011]
MRLGRAAIAVTAIAAIVVGLGATPAWASDAERLAWMLRDRTIAQARAAAEWETVDAEEEPAPEEPVAEATLDPGTPVTVAAPELGATVEFSGFQVDEQLTIEASPLPEEVVASAESELAAQVVAEPFEVTATTASGEDVTEFPAEPTFDDPDAAQPIVTEVTPGIALDIAVDKLEGLDPASLRIVTREQPGDPWLEVPSYYDETTSSVKGEIDHLSQFAVIGTPFVPPPGPRIVLDPDDNVGHTVGPNGPAEELPLNVRLANDLAAKLTEICLADVAVTRPVASPDFLSAETRAALAASHNPDLTVTIAFNALFGYEWDGDEDGGTQVYSRGGAADDALAWSVANTMPGYTGRPAHQMSNPAYPNDAFDGLPGAVVQVETLFMDHSQDRAVIDAGFDYIVAGMATSLGMYAESLGADCTDPATGGWPAKPSAATLASWKQLGYHYHQTFMGDPVSMSTGNLLEDEPLFTLAGPGNTDLDLTLIYNSQDGRESRVGTGWSFGLGARAQRFDDGSVLVVRGDGASVVFEPDGAGGYVTDPDVHDTLVEAGMGRLQLATPAGEVSVFDAADIEGIGELVSYRDALGTGYDLAYGPPDEDDRFVPLTSITDTAGQTIAITKNAAGQIETLTHPDGRAWTLGYGTGGDLVSITGPDGTRAFTYDDEHRMLTAADVAGVTYLRNQFDDQGRVTKQWDADGNLRTFEYTGGILESGSTVYTDNEGEKTVFEWDEASRITSITDAEGGVERFEYDEAGNTVAHTDENGATTEFAHDENGNVTRETLPDGTVRSYTYTPLGVVASITDQGGASGAARTTTFEVTPQGLTTAAHLPDGSTVNFTYTAAGDLASVTDQAGNVTTFVYDAVGNLLSVTDPLGQVTSHTYDAAGRVLTTTDPTGAVTSFAWDDLDHLVSTTDGTGATTTYTYNHLDKVSSVTDPLGATTRFEWDDMVHLVAVTAADGGVTRFEYNAEDALVASVDPLGVRTEFEVDALGRVIETTDAAGNTWQTAYDAVGNLTTETDPLGGVTKYAYDALGQVTVATDPTGAVTRFSYDQVGRLATVTDALGGVTTNRYTLNDLVASVTDAEGTRQQFRYDSVGNRTTVIDQRGQTWRTAYDALGRVTSETDPLGAVTRYTYDSAARTISTTDPVGATTTIGLDAAGRAVTVTDPLGAVTSATYDLAGRVTAVTNPLGATERTAYDTVGRVTALTDALGAVTAYDYDRAGRVTQETDALGSVTAYRYTKLGQLASVTKGYKQTPTTATGSDVNLTTRYTYTPTGQLASTTNPVGAVTRWEYDPRGLPVAETNPLGITSRTAYDSLGRPVEATDGNGATTRTQYSSTSLVERIAYPDGTTVGFEYDKAGNPIVMTDALGATGWTYDKAGRLTAQTDPLGTTLGYGYDAAGNRTRLDVGSTSLGYRYDKAGQLVEQTSPGASIGYAWDAAGNLTQQSRSTGVTTTFGYDAAGQVTRIAHQTPVVGPAATSGAQWLEAAVTETKPVTCASAATVGDTAVTSYLSDRSLPTAGVQEGCEKTDEYAADRDLPDLAEVFTAGEAITYDYAYDSVGNVTSEVETLGSQGSTTTGYLYDRVGRMTQSWDTTGTVNTYRFDKAGNRTAWITPKAPDTGEPLIVDSAFNAAGQVTSQYRARPEEGATSVGFTYDGAGNRVSQFVSGPDGEESTSYAYTSTGRLASVTAGDDTTTFGYDGLGRNLTVTEESWAQDVTTTRSWDGLTPVTQTSTAGGTSTLVRDALGVIALQGGDDPTWVLGDRLGSSVATTDSSGRVDGLADYSDYGVPTYASTGFAAVTGFSGELSGTTTGYSSYFARTFDTFTSTWLTPDTWRGTLTDPASQARYGYTEGNPATFVDAFGFLTADRLERDALARGKAGSGSWGCRSAACDTSYTGGGGGSAPCVGRGCRTAAGDSYSPPRHPPVCGARAQLPGCTPRVITQQQRDNAQNVWAAVGGVAMGFAYTAAIAGLLACTVVTLGGCGVAAVAIALGVGGAAGALATYNWSTGPKTTSGYVNATVLGGATGAIGGVAGPALRPLGSAFTRPASSAGTSIAPVSLANATQVTGMRFAKEAAPNTVLYKTGSDGLVTSYQTYDSVGLPIKRVDLIGAPHNGIPTPHVQEFGRHTNPETGITYVTKSGDDVRPAEPWEIPQ